ncbi:(d)CMP kinase [Sporanaerobacter acetigenes]|uniref:Cytidylate kinase n=1 Tax=Sporanaerobacter acetigenes DSM 13106 TaxID=1123281 RepID=A0A1M5XMK9_9FIRM|nr:(d)CMP kinase [Sporanaerobacter acetigenes]SHI00778.1 cytidylate kinase [Sporanaerobacter acetigenes DSM 13106]
MNGSISIAIDGPAGAGKSTIAKIVANRLEIDYIDTGAMYRAFTYKLLCKNIDFNDEKTILKELEDTLIDFRENHIYLDGKIVDKQIRDNIINQNVSYIAKIKEIRDGMVRIQRNIAKDKSIVMDGRDIGTVVLPNADYKFFIVASIEERAKRRYKDLLEKGETTITLEQVKEELEKRDTIDSTREIAPLIKAENAIEVDTTNQTIEESVDTILKIIEGR